MAIRFVPSPACLCAYCQITRGRYDLRSLNHAIHYASETLSMDPTERAAMFSGYLVDDSWPMGWRESIMS